MQDDSRNIRDKGYIPAFFYDEIHDIFDGDMTEYEAELIAYSHRPTAAPVNQMPSIVPTLATGAQFVIVTQKG